MKQYQSSEIRNFAIVGHGASGKRGKIMGMDADGKFQIIKAHVPQAELYHYATTVRSLTGGRGIHIESLSHYEKMPKDIEKRIIKEQQKHEDE